MFHLLGGFNSILTTFFLKMTVLLMVIKFWCIGLTHFILYTSMFFIIIYVLYIYIFILYDVY